MHIAGASKVTTAVFVRILFLWDVIFSVHLTFENGSTRFLRNVKDKRANDSLLSLSLSDTEVVLFSFRSKPVQPAAANVHLPSLNRDGADWTSDSILTSQLAA